MNREGRCTTFVRPRSSFECIVCRTFRGRCIGYFCRCAAMRHTTESTFPFSCFDSSHLFRRSILRMNVSRVDGAARCANICLITDNLVIRYAASNAAKPLTEIQNPCAHRRCRFLSRFTFVLRSRTKSHDFENVYKNLACLFLIIRQ